MDGKDMPTVMWQTVCCYCYMLPVFVLYDLLICNPDVWIDNIRVII